MVENTLVKEQLDSAMIDAGAALTEKLDELGVPTTAAFWFFISDINEWRLLFASPDVSAKGSRNFYEKIHLAIEQLGEKASAIPLLGVSVLDDHADLVQKLRTAVSTGPGTKRIRFSKNVADGRFIDDALIYRIV
jgi:hypothetical protein